MAASSSKGEDLTTQEVLKCLVPRHIRSFGSWDIISLTCGSTAQTDKQLNLKMQQSTVSKTNKSTNDPEQQHCKIIHSHNSTAITFREFHAWMKTT